MGDLEQTERAYEGLIRSIRDQKRDVRRRLEAALADLEVGA